MLVSVCVGLVCIVFDWDFHGGATGTNLAEIEGTGDVTGLGRLSTSNKVVDGVPRLRDAAIPSSPVILPGPALLPSMGSQPLRLNNNGRARKSRIMEQGPQLIPNVPSG